MRICGLAILVQLLLGARKITIILFSHEFRNELGFIAQDDQSFDVVLDFPYVSLPAVVQEQFHQAGGYFHALPVVHFGISFQEIIDEERDVLLAFPQRRKKDIHHVDPIVEIPAEAVLLHPPFKIFIRRGQDPAVDLPFLFAADPEKLFLLENIEEFRLEVHVHFTDFVQEDRPVLRDFEPAIFPPVSSGEGPPFESEELAFQEFPREGGAVDLDERLPRTIGCLVKSLGDQVFSGPALPRDEDRDVRIGDLVQDCLNLAHLVAHGKEKLVLVLDLDLGFQFLELPFGLCVFEYHLDFEQQLLATERLLDVIVRTVFHRAYDLLDVALPRYHDDGNVHAFGPEWLDEVHPVPIGEENIEDDAGKMMIVEVFHRRCLVEGGGYLHPLLDEKILGKLGEYRVVVNDEDIRYCHSFPPAFPPASSLTSANLVPPLPISANNFHKFTYRAIIKRVIAGCDFPKEISA